METRKDKFRQKITDLIGNELVTLEDLESLHDSAQWYVKSKSTCDIWHKRCITCGLRRTKEGHDPCIPNLPGVKAACCGHGNGDAYIHFNTGTVIRGEFSIELTEDDVGANEEAIQIIGNCQIIESSRYGFGDSNGWKACGTCKNCRLQKTLSERSEK
jgi:hypothetical protein